LLRWQGFLILQGTANSSFVNTTSYKKELLLFLTLLCSLFFAFPVFAQRTENRITVIAGKQYSRSAFYQWLWGRHYRQEWATPVSVPLFYLDTAVGGLKPYAAGGGRQSKTLSLNDRDNRYYVLRRIDKTYGKALPD
jgi:hypothetical protein